MPLIQVRDVPEHIYRRLAEQAKTERRSLSQQTIAVLAKGLDVSVDLKARRQWALAEIRRRSGGPRRTAPDFARLIREDRDR
jgi:hypothetical protein